MNDTILYQLSSTLLFSPFDWSLLLTQVQLIWGLCVCVHMHALFFTVQYTLEIILRLKKKKMLPANKFYNDQAIIHCSAP